MHPLTVTHPFFVFLVIVLIVSMWFTIESLFSSIGKNKSGRAGALLFLLMAQTVAFAVSGLVIVSWFLT